MPGVLMAALLWLLAVWTGGAAAQTQAMEPLDHAVCRLIESAAKANRLPTEFLTKLIWRESSFRAGAVSPAGAQGIAQFMPGTARAMGLEDPYDAGQAIDAQARLMRDLLRQFGAVPLALAAYNAGAGAVARCGCIPPYPETRGYVARILGLLGGMGELGSGSVVVRLVE